MKDDDISQFVLFLSDWGTKKQTFVSTENEERFKDIGRAISFLNEKATPRVVWDLLSSNFHGLKN